MLSILFSTLCQHRPWSWPIETILWCISIFGCQNGIQLKPEVSCQVDPVNSCLCTIFHSLGKRWQVADDVVVDVGVDDDVDHDVDDDDDHR